MSGQQTYPAGQGRAVYLLVVALVCSTFSYMDRQVISLVVEPIKHSLALSDTQIGLLQGLAFSLCYAVAGLPLALAVDRYRRSAIGAGCIAVWSIGTSACGLVTGFPAFLAARALTATSEAGFSPAALSMLSDLVPPRRRARTSAIYLLGPSLGVGCALLIGGLLLKRLTAAGGLSLPLAGHLLPWQGLFVCIGAPGLLLALLFALTVREPRRTGADEAFAATDRATGLREALRESGAFLIPYVLGSTSIMLVQFAQAAWSPTYFVRSWHLLPAQAGQMLGPIFLLTSLLGAATAALLVRGGDGRTTLERIVRIVLVGGAVLGPGAVVMALAPNMAVALTAYAVVGFSFSLVATLATAPMLIVLPSAVRGQALAAGGFILAVVGGGGGPLAVGFITDHVLHDEARVGVALALVCAVAVVIGMALMLRARAVLRGAGWAQLETVAPAGQNMGAIA